MQNTNQNGFLNDLEKVAKARQDFSKSLFGMSKTIETFENQAGAKLELQPVIESLNKNATHLKEGVFRLLVLGDMKRGKSTFLNALLGESVLPADVNPCTAILTKLKHGKQSGVQVFYNDGKPPLSIGFADFKKRFTIPPDEAKHYQEENIKAFPDVSHAEISYPLELLEKGVEIIDSPGLNDTEDRNELSLGYIQNSHAILFVLSATQAFTLGERRYFDNYIRGKGLSVFFLINMWDEIRNKLVDPDDLDELNKAENNIRQVFRTNLESEFKNGQSRLEQRVFEISALNALRARLGRAGYSWNDSGFAAFVNSLVKFLTQDRAIAEMQLARLTARSASKEVREKASLQINLLSQSTGELKEKINAVQPEFNELSRISKEFDSKIGEVRNQTANELADSFKSYFSNLTQTFEEDFTRYMPEEIGSLKMLRKDNREQFKKTMEAEFERYFNDRIADWSKLAETKIENTIAELNRDAIKYAVSYTNVTNRITQTLTDSTAPVKSNRELIDESPLWQRVVAGGLSAMTGDFAGAAMAGAGIFNWKTIFTNLGIVLGASALLYLVAGVVFTPLGATLLGLGLGGWQLNKARRKFIETAKDELSKQLPTIAEKGSDKVYQSVYQQFTDYAKEVQNLIGTDIESRREQLNNLLKEREEKEVDIQKETNLLQNLIKEIESEREEVEAKFDELLGSANATAVTA